MKKAILTAVFLVLAATLIAVWFSLERPESERVRSPVADFSDHFLPDSENSDTDRSTLDSTFENTPESIGASPRPNFPNSDPARLFSTPDFGSIAYRNANDRAAQYAARRPNTQSIHLLQRNEAAIDEIVRQLNENPHGLATSFQIGPSEIRPCTISSIDYRSPAFTPGILIPAKYRIEAKCHERGLEATVLVDSTLQGSIGVTIRSSLYGGMSIYSIDDSGYAIAFQDFPPVRSRSGN